MLLVLYANEKGQVFEHPAVEALGRSEQTGSSLKTTR
jgi:hypothetical protein